MTIPTIDELYRAGWLSGLDYHFARTLGRLAAEEDPMVLLAMGAVSRHTARGHVCFDISRFSGNAMVSDAGELLENWEWPGKESWLRALEKSTLVVQDDVSAPLVMDGKGRVYLARYWQYQQRLLEQLKMRSQREVEAVNRELLDEGLDRLFPQEDNPEPDHQRLAAETSVRRHFTVVSGGPGTGKTHAVVKMLQLMVEQALTSGMKPPRILLAAPTGKAAARLKAAVAAAKTAALHEASERIRELMAAIPDEAATIHRMLGLGGEPAHRFQETPKYELPADVVVVDEASMVDLSLMTRLLEATPLDARLILLGDKDQLASVEAGAVLGDICGGASASGASGIGDSIVQLTRSYRFDSGGDISVLAGAIRDGDSRKALGYLKDIKRPGVSMISMPDSGTLPRVLAAVAKEEYLPCLSEEDSDRKWAVLNSFRILCAHRHGPSGVDRVNQWVERFLLSEGGIEARSHWYSGRPVMVIQNDYQLNLFNGDVGVAAPSRTSPGELAVYFPESGESGLMLMPSRLPPHETVYAMTVHKSQGSEFDRVLLVLPPRRSPVVTRELLYTAVTRAKERVTILGDENVIREAVETPVQRASGLSEELMGIGIQEKRNES